MKGECRGGLNLVCQSYRVVVSLCSLELGGPTAACYSSICSGFSVVWRCYCLLANGVVVEEILSEKIVGGAGSLSCC
uniref:Putative ovule protein n=1 Tax=Solanum chacoense TaxID=4108 RepID=A0A0V0I867_SOLCH